MINLGRCLVYLLERHDCVAVGGIGTFRKIRKPGYFDEATQSYYPPSGDIVFEADAGTGEGAALIVDHVAAQRRVTRSVAQASYRKNIAAVLKELDAEGQAVLDGLGQLKQDGEQLLFSAAVPADPVLRAMPAVRELEVLPVSRPESPVLPAEEPDAAPGSAGVSDESPLVSDADEAVRSPRGGLFWKIAAITVIVLGILMAAGAFFRPDLMQELRLSLAVPGRSQPVATPASLEIVSGESAAQEPGLEQEPAEPAGPAQDPASGTGNAEAEGLAASADTAMTGDTTHTGPVVTYEIIVASFKTMEQAHTFVAQMKEKGVELRAIDSKQPQNRKKVSYGSYSDKNAAYRDLPRVQKTLEPTAWVDRIVR